MKQKIEIIQSQKQQFSSKMIHSMNMLQMSYHELATMIDASLLENPFSDIDECMAMTSIEDVENQSYTVKRNNNEDLQTFDIADTDDEDLFTYVRMQLEPEIKTNKDRQIIQFLLESLDAKGYLIEGISEICKVFDLTQQEGMRYLSLMQSANPKGIGARNLKECLLLQIEESEQSTLIKKIINFYLEYVGAQNYVTIAKKENVSLECVKYAVQEIKSLNPIPANGFSLSERMSYMIPDVYITFGEDEMSIRMNDGFEKKLVINEESVQLYKQAGLDKASREYLSQKLKDFRLLKYYTTRRNITLRKIITALAQYQQTFLKTGDKRNLKPLRLIDLEEIIGLHSSTISRALQGKFFSCDYGTYTFKTLVPRMYSKKGVETTSKNMIKEEIREIIENEDKTSPYSDQQIQLFLEEEGYPVSRRSVSKYREELLIPSSHIRRQL